MLVKGINSPFEKKRIITYGCDGNKAVYHYIPLQQVVRCLYKSKTEIVSGGYDECRLYICFPGYPGLDIGSFSHINNKTVEELWQSCVDSGLDTPENFIRMLDGRAQERQHMGNCQIELAKYMDQQKAEQYIAVKKSIQEEREHRQAEKQAKYLAEKERLARQEKEARRASLLGWGDTLPELQLTRVLDVLSKEYRYNGVVKTRLQHVIDCIAGGYRPEFREKQKEYRLVLPQENCCLSYAITKTEYDFAAYLYNRREKQYA